jgi:hypothetical protein
MKTLETPNGYEEMIKVFGDIRSYINEDGTLNVEWEKKILDRVYLPYPLKLSWNGQLVTRMSCHYLLVFIIQEVFRKIMDNGLEGDCREFGGCYMFRVQRGSKKISTHAWGIALDLEPTKNPLGGPVSMNPKVIEIFESLGFVWGGSFKRIDGMHFQYCSGV